MCFANISARKEIGEEKKQFFVLKQLPKHLPKIKLSSCHIQQRSYVITAGSGLVQENQGFSFGSLWEL